MKIDDSQVIEVDEKKKKKVSKVKEIKDADDKLKKDTMESSKTLKDENVSAKKKVSSPKTDVVKKAVTKTKDVSKKVLDYDTNIDKIKNVKIDDNKFKYIMIFILGFVIAFAGFYCFNDYLVSKDGSNVTISENDISGSIDKIYDAVVYIENYKGNSVSTSGTGFIYKKDNGKAYILTNNHVVSNSSSLKVIMASGEKVTAKYLGGDEYLDIACLSIDDKYVTKVATFGSSSELKLGATLFTVGSPVDNEYQGTVTRGILSGKDRFVSVTVSGTNSDYVMKVLQTDAAMNPGNSGGPLCNVNGEVIGVNSLKLVRDEIEGMGFAIAIEDIKGHLETFESGKDLDRPYLGIAIFNLKNSRSLAYYGLADLNTKLEKGVIVESVEEGSASYGKLQKGDIIIKLNGASVDDMAHFRYELFKHEPGDRITLSIERDGKYKDVVVVPQSEKDK